MEDPDAGAPDADTPVDNIGEIRALFQLFNDAFKQSYNLDREVSIDESMLLWKGFSPLQRYIPCWLVQRPVISLYLIFRLCRRVAPMRGCCNEIHYWP